MFLSPYKCCTLKSVGMSYSISICIPTACHIPSLSVYLLHAIFHPYLCSYCMSYSIPICIPTACHNSSLSIPIACHIPSLSVHLLQAIFHPYLYTYCTSYSISICIPIARHTPSLSVYLLNFEIICHFIFLFSFSSRVIRITYRLFPRKNPS
jgi:hypothetical protein